MQNMQNIQHDAKQDTASMVQSLEKMSMQGIHALRPEVDLRNFEKVTKEILGQNELSNEEKYRECIKVMNLMSYIQKNFPTNWGAENLSSPLHPLHEYLNRMYFSLKEDLVAVDGDSTFKVKINNPDLINKTQKEIYQILHKNN